MQYKRSGNSNQSHQFNSSTSQTNLLTHSLSTPLTNHSFNMRTFAIVALFALVAAAMAQAPAQAEEQAPKKDLETASGIGLGYYGGLGGLGYGGGLYGGLGYGRGLGYGGIGHLGGLGYGGIGHLGGLGYGGYGLGGGIIG